MEPDFPHPNLSAELLDLLRCPVTLQKLRLATPAELARIQPLPKAALMRADGAVLYPIRDGIPVLLAEEAVQVAS